MKRSSGLLMVLAASVVAIGCGGSSAITADTTCEEYLSRDQAARHDAAIRISSEIDGLDNPGNPMWGLSLDAACGESPSMTVGEYFGAPAGEQADGASAADGESAPEESVAEDFPVPTLDDLTVRISGAGWVANVPSTSEGWSVDEEPSGTPGIASNVLRGPGGTVIRIVHTPSERAETPDPGDPALVSEQTIDAAAEEAYRVSLTGVPTEECEGRVCSKWLLNDPEFGGIAVTVNGVKGNPSYKSADLMARTVRGTSEADTPLEQLVSDPEFSEATGT